MTHSCSFMMLVLTMLFACNSRPPYFRERYEFTTNCDGGASAVIMNDPDPESHHLLLLSQTGNSVDAAPIVALKTIESAHGVDVHLRSGKHCVAWPGSVETADCQFPDDTVADCSSSIRLLELHRPTLHPEKYPELQP